MVTLLLMLKITLSLFFTMATGVFIGNTFWNYNIAIMPWWFKYSLGFVALSFFISLFALVMMGIWSIQL
jgi:hypothetical protein